MKTADKEALGYLLNLETPESRSEIAERYYFGYGVDKDKLEALKWFLLAANQGHTKSQYMVGWLYAQGTIVDYDREKAIHYLELAAETSNPAAEHILGCLYFDVTDFNKARFWLFKAAKSGHAGAQALMGDLYRKGLGVKQDYQKALDWYIEDAESENPISQYGLSVMYREGLGVEKDLIQSADWAKLAREQGYPPDEEELDL